MVKTYVLIVTNPGRTRRVTEALAAVPQVEAVSEVMGPYDIVAEVVTEDLGGIRPVLTGRIRAIEGVQSTTSLVALPGGSP